MHRKRHRIGKSFCFDFLLDTSNPVRFVGYDFQTIRDKGNRCAARPIPAIHSIPGRAVRPVHACLRNRVDEIAVVQQVVRLAKIILGDLKRHILREVVDAAGIALRPSALASISAHFWPYMAARLIEAIPPLPPPMAR